MGCHETNRESAIIVASFRDILTKFLGHYCDYIYSLGSGEVKYKVQGKINQMSCFLMILFLIFLKGTFVRVTALFSILLKLSVQSCFFEQQRRATKHVHSVCLLSCAVTVLTPCFTQSASSLGRHLSSYHAPFIPFYCLLWCCCYGDRASGPGWWAIPLWLGIKGEGCSNTASSQLSMAVMQPYLCGNKSTSRELCQWQSAPV